MWIFLWWEENTEVLYKKTFIKLNRKNFLSLEENFICYNLFWQKMNYKEKFEKKFWLIPKIEVWIRMTQKIFWRWEINYSHCGIKKNVLIYKFTFPEQICQENFEERLNFYERVPKEIYEEFQVLNFQIYIKDEWKKVI